MQNPRKWRIPHPTAVVGSPSALWGWSGSCTGHRAQCGHSRHGLSARGTSGTSCLCVVPQFPPSTDSGGRHRAPCQAQPPLSCLGFHCAPATTSSLPNPSVPALPALQAVPRGRQAGRAVGSHQPPGTELALTCLPAPAGFSQGQSSARLSWFVSQGGQRGEAAPPDRAGWMGSTGAVPARCRRCDGEMFVCQKQGLQSTNLGRILWFLFIWLEQRCYQRRQVVRVYSPG